MGPVLRISGREALTLSLSGLTSGQTDAINKLIRTSDAGAGFNPVPAPSFPRNPESSASGTLALTGDPARLRRLVSLLAAEPRIPSLLSSNINSRLDNYLRTDYKIDCKGKLIDLARGTRIMGILNVTPDSFSDGGRFSDRERALAHAREMAAAGADIIDIGGESTRPGALSIPLEEELRRTLPVIEALSAELAVPLSIDTYKASVAEKALRAGAAIVNDISGLRFDPDMAKVVADSGAAVVVMHIKGTPRDMQQDPVYGDVVSEIIEYLDEGIGIALAAGVAREKILIDPGIGFGKTLEHNLTILNRLDEFRVLGRPLVLGTSRKRFIGAVLNIPEPEQRAFGTAATVALGIAKGARILRVHDVAHMARTARMTDAIMNS